jgi:hypothetical protein
MGTARMTRAEEQAACLPALLTVPIIVLILPTLFIVLLGSAAIGVIDTFAHRWPAPPTAEVAYPGAGLAAHWTLTVHCG